MDVQEFLDEMNKVLGVEGELLGVNVIAALSDDDLVKLNVKSAQVSSFCQTVFNIAQEEAHRRSSQVQMRCAVDILKSVLDVETFTESA